MSTIGILRVPIAAGKKEMAIFFFHQVLSLKDTGGQSPMNSKGCGHVVKPGLKK